MATKESKIIYGSSRFPKFEPRFFCSKPQHQKTKSNASSSCSYCRPNHPSPIKSGLIRQSLSKKYGKDGEISHLQKIDSILERRAGKPLSSFHEIEFDTPQCLFSRFYPKKDFLRKFSGVQRLLELLITFPRVVEPSGVYRWMRKVKNERRDVAIQAVIASLPESELATINLSKLLLFEEEKQIFIERKGSQQDDRLLDGLLGSSTSRSILFSFNDMAQIDQKAKNFLESSIVERKESILDSMKNALESNSVSKIHVTEFSLLQINKEDELLLQSDLDNDNMPSIILKKFSQEARMSFAKEKSNSSITEAPSRPKHNPFETLCDDQIQDITFKNDKNIDENPESKVDHFPVSIGKNSNLFKKHRPIFQVEIPIRNKKISLKNSVLPSSSRFRELFHDDDKTKSNHINPSSFHKKQDKNSKRHKTVTSPSKIMQRISNINKQMTPAAISAKPINFHNTRVGTVPHSNLLRNIQASSPVASSAKATLNRLFLFNGQERLKQTNSGTTHNHPIKPIIEPKQISLKQVPVESKAVSRSISPFSIKPNILAAQPLSNKLVRNLKIKERPPCRSNSYSDLHHDGRSLNQKNDKMKFPTDRETISLGHKANLEIIQKFHHFEPYGLPKPSTVLSHTLSNTNRRTSAVYKSPFSKNSIDFNLPSEKSPRSKNPVLTSRGSTCDVFVSLEPNAKDDVLRCGGLTKNSPSEDSKKTCLKITSLKSIQT